jgi:hypothetical protein
VQEETVPGLPAFLKSAFFCAASSGQKGWETARLDGSRETAPLAQLPVDLWIYVFELLSHRRRVVALVI